MQFGTPSGLAPYPVEFMPALRNVVRLVRENAIGQELPLFLHSGWTLQGYAQSQVVGEAPDEPPLRGAPPNGDPFETLAAAADAPEGTKMMIPIPWAQVLTWVASKLIEAYLLRQTRGG